MARLAKPNVAAPTVGRNSSRTRKPRFGQRNVGDRRRETTYFTHEAYVSETDLASVTAGLLREGTSQPARACEAFKYQPCRLTIASLVLRKAAEFSTHPAFEACSKLDA